MYLRSSVRQEHPSSLAATSIREEPAQKLSNDDLIKDFGDRKRSLEYPQSYFYPILCFISLLQRLFVTPLFNVTGCCQNKLMNIQSILLFFWRFLIGPFFLPIYIYFAADLKTEFN